MPESIESVLRRDQHGDYADWTDFDDALWGVARHLLMSIHSMIYLNQCGSTSPLGWWNGTCATAGLPRLR